jgi:hypothetical protein
MRIFGVIASRHRGWDASLSVSEQLGSDSDRRRIEELLNELSREFGDALLIVGLGADCGINRFIRECCQEKAIPYVEVRIGFSQHVPSAVRELCLLARHEAVAALCGEVRILLGRGRMGHIEDLIHVLRRQHVPFVALDEEWNVVEDYHG